MLLWQSYTTISPDWLIAITASAALSALILECRIFIVFLIKVYCNTLFCVRMSPQQITGVMPCSNALVLSCLQSHLSLPSILFSQCPIITYLTPTSISSIFRAISPVYAPLSSSTPFSAPISILPPLAASMAGIISVRSTRKQRQHHYLQLTALIIYKCSCLTKVSCSSSVSPAIIFNFLT